MLYARTYDMQVKTYDVVYDENIRCRTSDLRYRMHVRHRISMSYVHHVRHRNIRCRTWCTYNIVRVLCRTCITYDIVCNIGIIRCRTSDVRHRTSIRIQMQSGECTFDILKSWLHIVHIVHISSHILHIVHIKQCICSKLHIACGHIVWHIEHIYWHIIWHILHIGFGDILLHILHIVLHIVHIILHIFWHILHIE